MKNYPTKKELKQLPSWRNVKGTKFIYNGAWSDPEIYYKGRVFNVYDVESGLDDEDLQDPEAIKGYLDDLCFAGCGERYKEGDGTYLIGRMLAAAFE